MRLFGLLYRAALDLRRLLSTGALLAALLAGLAFGALRGALPEELVARAAVLVLGVLLAGLLAGGRVHARALSRLAPTSLASALLTAGRLLGGAAAAAVLASLFVAAAGLTSPELERERPLSGLAEGGRWRFELPAGTAGALPLELATLLPFSRTGRLEWTLQRGSATRQGSTLLSESGIVRLALPDLSPARGNLRLQLVARDGLVLVAAPPRLILGTERVARPALRFERAQLLRLLLVALVTLGAACAFAPATACLAGWLVLLTPAEVTPRSVLVLGGLLVLMSSLGFALRRRTQLA